MIDNPWFGLALWLLSYVADYTLTLYSARLYRQGAQEYVVFEGSLELTPYYQADIDQLRRVSLRFILAVVWSVLLLELMWYLSLVVLKLPAAFEFVLGGLVLREAAVLMRHVRNISQFRAMRASAAGASAAGAGGPGLSGKISYTRRFSLRQSAVELWTYAALFGLLAPFTASWLLAGGAFACLLTGLQHWRRSRQTAKPTAAPASGA